MEKRSLPWTNPELQAQPSPAVAKKATRANIYHKAMDYLAIRDHSEQELRQKLRQKFPQDNIDPVIAKLKQEKFLLPPEVLTDKVAQNLHRKLKGYFYINQYLKKIGLPTLLAEPELEIKKAQTLIERNKDLGWSKDKWVRYLANRGYQSDVIFAALKQMKVL